MSDTAMCSECDHPTTLRCCEGCQHRACEFCDEWGEAPEGGWLCSECARK